MRHSIPSELLQAVHNYLVTRPMREVEALVTALRENSKLLPAEEQVAPVSNDEMQSDS